MDQDIDMYTVTDAANNRMTLYNKDYFLYKTVSFTPPAGYIISHPDYITRDLFNADDKIEFIVILELSPTPEHLNTLSICRIYNEDGTVIKDLGTAYSFNSTVHKISADNSWRLAVNKMSYSQSSGTKSITEIYSLPGNASTDNISPQNIKNNQLFAYPNPSNTIINLMYQLKQGEKNTMNVFDIQGKLIEQIQLDYTFNQFPLDVSAYRTGVYIYEINGTRNKFIVK